LPYQYDIVENRNAQTRSNFPFVIVLQSDRGPRSAALLWLRWKNRVELSRNREYTRPSKSTASGMSCFANEWPPFR